MKIKMNFFKKMFLYSMGIVLTTLSIGYILNFIFLEHFHIYRKEQAMQNIAVIIKEHMDDPQFLEEYIENLKEREAIGVTFLNAKGQEMFFDSEDPRMMRRSMMHKQLLPRFELRNKTFIIKDTPQAPGRLLIYNEKLPDKTWISLRASLTGADTYQYELYLFNMVACIVTLMIAAIIGRIFSKKMTADLEKINKIAYRIADLEFVEDIGIDREDEIGELAKNMERMSKKLKISIEGMKSFVSNASHELKTPVAIINSSAQGLLKKSVITEEGKKEYYETILRTSKEMNELITNLLTISKINSLDYSFIKEDIDIKDLINESLEKYDFLELDNDIDVDIHINSSSIKGDRKLIRLVIDNIVMNGLKYSPYEGKFEIVQEGSIISFKNSLSNKSKLNLEKIWDPFYRGEGRTESEIEGSGLGLSIVKKVLELHKFNYGAHLEEDKFCIWIKFDPELDNQEHIEHKEQSQSQELPRPHQISHDDEGR